MAAILINPTSAQFTSSGGSGSIALTVETDSWHTEPTDNDVWMAQRKRTNLTWSSWSVIKIKGEDGEDGIDGTNGTNGRGIVGTPTISYQGSSSGQTVPTGTWRTTPPAINAGQYMWTRTTFTYTDGTTSNTYSVARWGLNGDSTSTQSPTLLYQGYFNRNPQTGASEIRTYYGNDTRRDVVYDSTTSQYYAAKQTAGEFSDSASSPSSAYWDSFGASFDSVATGLAFVEQAYIENGIIRILETANTGSGQIMAKDNHMEMFDSNSNLRLSISGEDLGSASGTTTVSIPSRTAMSVSQNLSTMDDPYVTESLGPATSITVTDSGNSVTFAQTNVTFNIAGSLMTSGSKTIYCSAGYAIDGVCLNRISAPETTITSSSSSTSAIAFIPALTTSLTPGTHTVQIFARIAVIGSATGSGNFTCTATSVASSASIVYTAQCFQIRANGIRMMFGSNYMFEAAKTGTSDSTIAFTMRAGSYGIKVDNTGIYKLSSGSWAPASL